MWSKSGCSCSACGCLAASNQMAWWVLRGCVRPCVVSHVLVVARDPCVPPGTVSCCAISRTEEVGAASISGSKCICRQQPHLQGAAVQVTTAVNIVRQEGVLVLWSGWQASVARSFLYGGEQHVARLGLTDPALAQSKQLGCNPSASGSSTQQRYRTLVTTISC